MYETYMTDDADIIAIAYGTTARVAKGAINRVRKDGIKAGLIRPISLWPFPGRIIREMAAKVKKIIVFEMSTGQMVEDVLLAVESSDKVRSSRRRSSRPG
jgi:2-oxoglutarate ferredoxin oxidoreductase subunit alpha